MTTSPPPTGGHHRDDSIRTDAATARLHEDRIHELRRRLLGVPREQLADERSTHEKRTAAIEARHRQR